MQNVHVIKCAHIAKQTPRTITYNTDREYRKKKIGTGLDRFFFIPLWIIYDMWTFEWIAFVRRQLNINKRWKRPPGRMVYDPTEDPEIKK